MFNIHYYTDYIMELGATRLGKTIYSVCAGAIGAVILVIFLTGILHTAALGKWLPIIIGFNAALTGYMVIDKTRNAFKRKRAVSMGSGVAMVVLAAISLNLLFVHWAGFNLISIDTLVVLLLVGIVTSVLGGMLSIKYLNLKGEAQ